MNDQLRRLQKKLEGDGPMEKHIILLKLIDALENAPDFGNTPELTAGSPQREWLSVVKALLDRLSPLSGDIKFGSLYNMLQQHWLYAINGIKGLISDAIAALKLELELDGRSEIGSAYAPGEVYRFFADLKTIISNAKKQVLVVDPYFNGDAFDAYLSTINSEITVAILANKYTKDIAAYVEKHTAQYGANIVLRKSKDTHDRLVFIDDNECWIMGGSVKDAGKKATYLIPVSPELAEQKLTIYLDIWNSATEVNWS